MELIVNHLYNKNNHLDVITNAIKNSKKISLLVSYVKETGIKTILKDDIIAGKEISILCSLDFDITDIDSIKRILEYKNVKCKFFEKSHGILHSKVWYFEGDNNVSCLVGSANLSYAALVSNTETSILLTNTTAKEKQILNKVENIFSELWEKSSETSEDELTNLIDDRRNRKRIYIATEKYQQNRYIKELNDSILCSIKDYINTINEKEHPTPNPSKFEKYNRNGWYLINNQWNIDDNLIEYLHTVCKQILKIQPVKLEKTNKDMNVLYDLLSLNPSRTRDKSKLTPYQTWIRQEKNVLLGLNFIYEYNKEFSLTKFGCDFSHSDTKDQDVLKYIYTSSLRQTRYHNISPINFFYSVIELTEYITQNEMGYFVQYARYNNDLHLVKNIILLYRGLNSSGKEQIDTYFKRKMPITNSFNRDLGLKMSLIAWCKDLAIEKDKNKTNENYILYCQ